MICGTGVATAVNLQPGRPIDRESPLFVFYFETKPTVGGFKASFDALLRVHQVRERVRDQTPKITCLQQPTVKTKIESVRARLDRIREERDDARDADELRRRKILFECAFPTRLRSASALNISQGS